MTLGNLIGPCPACPGTNCDTSNICIFDIMTHSIVYKLQTDFIYSLKNFLCNQHHKIISKNT